MKASRPDNTPKTSPTPTPAALQSVPLVDTQRQYRALQQELSAAVERVLASGRYVLGDDCPLLEEQLAAYCGAKHAIACASGSDALLLALLARGIGAGDEVIVPSYTFFATVSAVARVGAKPVFVDIEPTGFNLDSTLMAAAVTKATKAIIPVHLYGQCAEMKPIQSIAEQHGLTVIEDAAQAIGAEYHGQRAGTLGHMACFSFYPTKNLGGCGDGGCLTTDDDQLAASLRLLRVHGMEPRYYHQVLGINSRLDTLQAAVLNVKLPYLDSWTSQRQRLAERYTALFSAAGLDQVLQLPVPLADRRHVWNQYIVRVPNGQRDALRAHLTEQRVSSEIYYPVPMHRQPCFLELGWPEGSLPETERAARETVALPLFPELTDAEQDVVVEQIGRFFATTSDRAHALPGPKFLHTNAARQASVAR